MNKKLMVLFLLGLCVAPMPVYVLGQSPACPEQTYLPLSGYSFEIDLLQIAQDRYDPTDPDYAVRKPLLLNVTTIAMGRTVKYRGRACDEDGDLVQIMCTDGTLTALDSAGVAGLTVQAGTWLTVDSTGYYQWTWTPTQVGLTYHRIRARDIRPTTDDSRGTEGSIVIATVPGNEKPPVLCGGLPG